MFSKENTVNLVIRPEELTRVDPSRLNVHQTLDGAWVDSFGPGLPQITISGHTGWRRLDGADDTDGEERFRRLKGMVFDQWHQRRKEAIRAGTDPDEIQLVFADVLDQFAVVVAPVSFTLRRSKSRPLLLQYQIALTVLDQNIDQAAYLQVPGTAKENEILEQDGLESLISSIDEITASLEDVQNFIDSTLVAPVRDFMDKTSRLYSSVRRAIAAGDAIAGQLISVAQMTTHAGMNIFRTVAAIEELPSHIKNRLMSVSSAYSNIECVLRNAMRKQKFYPDYSPLFGSSNCSSTSGGRPLSSFSGTNPFYAVAPPSKPLPVKLTSSAQSNLNVLARNDSVLSPMSTPQLRSTVYNITSGMTVAA